MEEKREGRGKQLNMGKKAWKRAGTIVLVPMLSLSLIQVDVLAASYNEVRVQESVSVTQTDSSSSKNSNATVSVGNNYGEAQEANPEEVEFTEEEAVEKLRKLFPALRQAQVESAELGIHNQYPPPENQMVWDISWRYEKGNSSYGFNSRVDAITGDLYSVHLYGPFMEGNEVYYPPNVSKEEALKKAKAFIKEAAPSISTEELEVAENESYYMEQPLFGPVQYRFNFLPMVNGVPAPNSSISMTMDGNGNVLEFHRSNNIREYPSVEPAISLEEAEEQYAQNLQLSLQYITVGNSEDPALFLGWIPDQRVPMNMIDAQTGEFVSYTGEAVQAEGREYVAVPEIGTSFPVVTATPADGEFISVEQAAAIVEEVAHIPDNRTLQSKSRSKHWRNEKQEVWNLRWADEEQRYFGSFEETYALVDAQTGQLLEYREDRYPSIRPVSKQETEEQMQEAEQLSEQELQKIALELINKLYPNAAIELQWVKGDVQDPYLGGENLVMFSFQRFYEEIAVQRDIASITLDGNGQLKNYNMNRTDNLEEKVKGLEAKISQEEAKSQFIKDTKLQLRYQYFADQRPNVAPTSMTKLIYGQIFSDDQVSSGALDAMTGKWRSMWESAVQHSGAILQPIDVKGHWAEQELTTLVQYRILETDESGNIYPDQTISYGEWLEMMAKAVDPHLNQSYAYQTSEEFDISNESPYYASVQLAIRYQWLNTNDKNLRLDDPLTREELAVSLSYILGYNKLTSYLGNEQDVVAYTDREQIKTTGAVTLVDRLGLMNSADGVFAPQEKVSRAEAASVLMRLVYLQGKTDQVIGRYRKY